jgi:pimeloyl-ACP methyl ester carboxylesterase
MELTQRVREWRDRGAGEDVNGRRIHVFTRRGNGPLLLLLHGFPSSSFDWRLILEELPGRAVLAFDCLGFGLSEKPRDHTYTLAQQADIAEVLLARHAAELTDSDRGRAPVFFVAHDMGTSVATELMARDLEGSFGGAAGGYDLVGGVLFNGSMIQVAARPTLGL